MDGNTLIRVTRTLQVDFDSEVLQEFDVFTGPLSVVEKHYPRTSGMLMSHHVPAEESELERGVTVNYLFYRRVNGGWEQCDDPRREQAATA